MLHHSMSLRVQDQKRRLKDSIARLIVTAGGMSVLGALLLIFVYLVWIVLPIFSSPTLKLNSASTFFPASALVGAASIDANSVFNVDDNAQYAYLLAPSGLLSIYSLQNKASKLNTSIDNVLSFQLLSTQQLVKHVQLFAKSDDANGWVSFVDTAGNISLFKPKLDSLSTQQKSRLHSTSDNANTHITTSNPLLKTDALYLPKSQGLAQLSTTFTGPFAFTTDEHCATFVLFDQQQNLHIINATLSPSLTTSKEENTTFDRHSVEHRQGLHQMHNSKTTFFQFPATQWQSLGENQPISKVLITPDGMNIYLLKGSDLIILAQNLNVKGGENPYQVREVVDLSQGDTEQRVVDISLLAGAYSVLVTHQNNTVSQWFDVVDKGQRTFSLIRQYHSKADIAMISPDPYRKGFFNFTQNGGIEHYHTTNEERLVSEKPSISDDVINAAPMITATSNNERYLLLLTAKPVLAVKPETQKLQLTLYQMDNPYPEISWHALWDKIWYEGYPQPQYIWQSTAASDNVEAKFSLIPISFGTLKSAFFALLFAIPIAVCAAIYTGYFMSPVMRKIVKPSIELMEALPSVIIGFLAGLWFAPIVEEHLAAILVLLILLPLSTIIAGGVGALLLNPWRKHQMLNCRTLNVSHQSNAWYSLLLIPILIVITLLVFHYSDMIEQWLFNGDARIFLAQHHIGFDQRNALVVGIAMGFAVIPTIFTITEDAIFSVPKHLSDSSLALGATQWQTLMNVVLLTASPGIFSAIMLGLGRAVGETMIVLMATGNTPVMGWNIFEGMRTLSATIAIELQESAVASSHYRLLFLAALLLFIFTFVVNSLAEWIRQRLKERYRAL